MKEFKVWDTACECFIRQHMVQLHGNGSLVYKSGGYINDGIICDYIGKTDINDKKIYADSSIVEFELYETGKMQMTKKGYFTFDNDMLVYYMVLIDDERGSMPYHNSDIQNLRIVDTIQENKLGLYNERN